MSYLTTLALIAAMGLLMGCADIRVTQMTTNPPCYVKETSKTLPTLYCNGIKTAAIPSQALEGM